jgi:hypothetical protein
MKTLVIKTLATATGLAMLSVAPALAQPPHNSAAERGYGSPSSQHVTRDPNDVIVRGKVVGRDPDPFIRWSLERGYGMQGSQD